MIKTILAPIDGSSHAHKAVKLAGDLAAKYDAKVILLHAIHGDLSDDLAQMDQSEYTDGAPDLSSIMRSLDVTEEGTVAIDKIPFNPVVQREIGERIARHEEETLRKAGVSKVETLIDNGNPASLVIDAAKNENVDMIVMGSRGLGRLQGVILGSVSQKVNHLASCSCVIVK